MEDITKIIADNLIELRKKNNMTQGALAEKLNYSDNAVSRWEHGEVTPRIETLEQIAKIFNVPLRALIEKDAKNVSDLSDRTKMINRLATILISISLVWFTAALVFVVLQIAYGVTIWQIFCWSIPVVVLIMFPFGQYWGRHIYRFVILSIFVWSTLACLYLQLCHLTQWTWLIFIIGVPIQLALTIWAFIKPRQKKKPKQKYSV